MVEDKMTQTQRIRFEALILALNTGQYATQAELFNKADIYASYIKGGVKPSGGN